MMSKNDAMLEYYSQTQCGYGHPVDNIISNEKEKHSLLTIVTIYLSVCFALLHIQVLFLQHLNMITSHL